MNPRFVDALPPTQQRERTAVKRPKHYRTALILRQHPGQWAHIMQDVSGVTSTIIKKGGLVAFRPAGAFEAAARSNGKTVGKNKGKYNIYARYIGEPEAAPETDADLDSPAGIA